MVKFFREKVKIAAEGDISSFPSEFQLPSSEEDKKSLMLTSSRTGSLQQPWKWKHWTWYWPYSKRDSVLYIWRTLACFKSGNVTRFFFVYCQEYSAVGAMAQNWKWLICMEHPVWTRFQATTLCLLLWRRENRYLFYGCWLFSELFWLKWKYISPS